METKELLFVEDVRAKFTNGIRKAARTVGSTLGPRGTLVGIDLGYETWSIHDGVNVFRQIKLADKAEDYAVRVLREAANKQVDAVGDGTTQVTILAAAIYLEAQKLIATGVNPMGLRRDMEEAVQALGVDIAKIKRDIKTKEEKIQVATISCEEDALGDMIGALLHKLGLDAIITTETSNSDATYIEMQEGMQFDKGWASPYFITNPKRSEATVEKAAILLTDKTMYDIQDFVPMIEKLDKAAIRNLVFIAPEISGTFLHSMIQTKLSGGAQIIAIQAPYSGQRQKDFLEDLAVLTGATVISEDTGLQFPQIEPAHFGHAERVTATHDATLIVGGAGEEKQITQRIEQLREELTRQEGTEFEQEKLRERIGKLSQGVAVVYVGGQTDSEMKERKERAIDAIAATQAAIRGGIVAGGETVYLLLAERLALSTPGATIIKHALLAPFTKLLENAGLNPGRFIDSITEDAGVDVTTGELVDMFQKGIIDPAEVAENALKNALSVALQLMMTETLILPIDKEDKK